MSIPEILELTLPQLSVYREVANLAEKSTNPESTSPPVGRSGPSHEEVLKHLNEYKEKMKNGSG